MKPKLQAALERYAPDVAKRAEANPVIRANALMPSARFGLREEMKQAYGFDWREHVRGVTATFDAAGNLAFGDKRQDRAGQDRCGRLQPASRAGYTLDPAKVSAERKMPNIVVVAANAKGEIVRYYEAGETAPYFGSAPARDPATGLYDRSARRPHDRLDRQDHLRHRHSQLRPRRRRNSLYFDTQGARARPRNLRQRQRPASAAAPSSASPARSMTPLLNRTALAGQPRVKAMIDGFGFNMPRPGAAGEGTPPSTAAVLGQISGSPRRVHHMSAVVLPP